MSEAGHSMVEPIRPEDVVEQKRLVLPPEVLEAFNEQIVKKFDGKSANVKQKDVAKLIGEKLNITYSQILEEHLLDVEDIYRKVGWKVKYDKPSYDENFDSYFLFTRESK